ncbi:MAG: hypothetical protein IT361_13665 [Gemmatimonadaceae bacterium]|nr:hypothetical protein [Gemmatimonadaceae bacterium]
MPLLRLSRLDASLRATVISRTPLRYREGADARLDRPPHVRAASSLTWIGDRVALVQDDANFLALIDPVSGVVESVTLPVGRGGVRVFDDARGNKRDKFDFEACCTLRDADGPVVLAFGSGSLPARRRVLVVDRWGATEPRVTVVDATALYLCLEAERDFSGSEMNIEGALALDDVVRLYARGNGAARDGRVPVDATADLDVRALLAWLRDSRATPPPPFGIVQFDLGEIGDVRLGFTDATRRGAATLFSAAAETSADAVGDGEVAGSVVGVIPADGHLRHALLCDRDGQRLTDKVEGIVAVPAQRDMVYAVIDPDDHRRPSEFCEVRLEGNW